MNVITPKLLNRLWKNGIEPIKKTIETHTHRGDSLSSPVSIAKGGTGADNAASARSNLGMGAAATYPIADNDTTNNAAYLPTARIIYEHGRELDNVVKEVTETKKSVSDGKRAVASAITEKGVSTAADATFAVMAANIRSMADRQYETGKNAFEWKTKTVEFQDTGGNVNIPVEGSILCAGLINSYFIVGSYETAYGHNSPLHVDISWSGSNINVIFYTDSGFDVGIKNESQYNRKLVITIGYVLQV